MGRLGDVLEAIYESPRLSGALHARTHQVQDATRIRELHEWWSSRSPHGGSAGLLMMATSGDGPLDRVETDHELWWASSSRWRAEHGNRVYVFADGAFAIWAPDSGGTRDLRQDAPLPTWDAVLRLRWLLDWFDVTIGSDHEVAGRRCWQVFLRPTDQQSRLRIGMPRWFGSAVECSIDQETGVALSYVAGHDGEPVDSWTTTAFEMTSTIDASVFAFTPPDGSELRDPEEVAHESMLRSAREAGVDLSDIDPDDHHAVMQAFMRHQQGGFPGPVPPEDQAEQYLPVGPPPPDPDEAEAMVRDAFEKMLTVSDDGGIPAVQGGSNLGPSLAEAGTRAPGGTHPAWVRVDFVKLLSPDDAVAWFTLERGGRHLMGPVAGRARRRDGQWLVTRETFAQLVGSVGVRCPPPP
jgi:hypothetical protein